MNRRITALEMLLHNRLVIARYHFKEPLHSGITIYGEDSEGNKSFIPADGLISARIQDILID